MDSKLMNIKDKFIANNNANPIDESNEILYFSINQEYNCIAVGTLSGFKIFSSDPFQLFYEQKVGPISIIEMLYTTNLILLVGATEFGDFSPKKVTIWSTSQNIVLCSSWPFLEKINIAKINKKRMIICERNLMHIYTTADMKILHTMEIGYISLGKLVLSANSDKNNYVCYSSNNDEGVVKVYDTIYLNVKTTIKAHKSPVLRMAINYNGDMLCTSSCKGTIIRVFNLPKGDKIITYKRGIASAYIFCMNFSLDSDKLLVTSDTGTLHIFDLKKDREDGLTSDKKPHSAVKGVGKFLCNMVSSISNKLLPQDYEDIVSTSKSTVSMKSEIMKMSNIVSFTEKSSNDAYCFTSDGSFYLFTINYDTKAISKIYECNMKDLKMII